MSIFGLFFFLICSGRFVGSVNLHITNSCGSSTVCAKYWSPMNGVGGGCSELRPGASWDVAATPAWQGGTVWAIAGGCYGAACNTGPPSGVTQFDITVDGSNAQDCYSLSAIAGFNMGMSAAPSNPACASLGCSAPSQCPSNGETCPYGSTDYNIYFYAC